MLSVAPHSPNLKSPHSSSNSLSPQKLNFLPPQDLELEQPPIPKKQKLPTKVDSCSDNTPEQLSYFNYFSKLTLNTTNSALTTLSSCKNSTTENASALTKSIVGKACSLKEITLDTVNGAYSSTITSATYAKDVVGVAGKRVRETVSSIGEKAGNCIEYAKDMTYCAAGTIQGRVIDIATYTKETTLSTSGYIQGRIADTTTYTKEKTLSAAGFIQEKTLSSAMYAKGTTLSTAGLVQEKALSSVMYAKDTTLFTAGLIQEKAFSSVMYAKDTTLSTAGLIQEKAFSSVMYAKDTTLSTTGLIQQKALSSAMYAKDTTLSTAGYIQEKAFLTTKLAKETTIQTAHYIQAKALSSALYMLKLYQDASTTPKFPEEAHENKLFASVYKGYIAFKGYGGEVLVVCMTSALSTIHRIKTLFH